MTDEPGTYALCLRAETDGTVEVGALGKMSVRPGWFVYVGSAFGPGGLRARVQRHVRAEGALHWHIDYVRAVTTVQAVWYTADVSRRECDWATVLRAHEAARIPLAGFGASDCGCTSHLTAFESAPSWQAFRTRVRDRWPAHAPLRRIDAQGLQNE